LQPARPAFERVRDAAIEKDRSVAVTTAALLELRERKSTPRTALLSERFDPDDGRL
jgi:hypothetical protein